MGKFKRTEGPPAYGEGYHKRMMVMIRIVEQGPEVIHKEIADLWAEIMLRTDCLVEYEIAQVEDEIQRNKRREAGNE
ncbi:MAG TPA: hypothetical protein PLG94_12240 [Smithellaceae bacterium]|nr:hypothetical protein [Smithellaceae bacterium]